MKGLRCVNVEPVAYIACAPSTYKCAHGGKLKAVKGQSNCSICITELLGATLSRHRRAIGQNWPVSRNNTNCRAVRY